MGGGPEDFFWGRGGVMYYIGKINTGVQPGLGGPPILGGGRGMERGLGGGLNNSLIFILWFRESIL